MLYFQTCMLCQEPCRNVLCIPCHQDINNLAIDKQCKQCGAPNQHGDKCGACIKKPPAFDQTIAALVYDTPLAPLIQDFKFRGQWQLAKFFARYLKPPTADILLPVPLFAAREQWRGFNQSRELARYMPTNPPPTHNILVRQTDTRPQSQLEKPDDRLRNVRGAFAVRESLANKTILVLDDVMTTGATLNEIAKTLKKAGATTVINIVIARAVLG